MITFNQYDYNLWKIEKDSRLPVAKTRLLDFHVYGLQNDKEIPIVVVSYNFPKLSELMTGKKKAALYRFFRSHNVYMGWENTKDSWKNIENDVKIHIGLQYNLREKVELCSSILHTIVYFLDGQIQLNDKLPGIPRIMLDNITKKS